LFISGTFSYFQATVTETIGPVGDQQGTAVHSGKKEESSGKSSLALKFFINMY
jgi:hypothetical protein